jgi:hypothetical protein
MFRKVVVKLEVFDEGRGGFVSDMLTRLQAAKTSSQKGGLDFNNNVEN